LDESGSEELHAFDLKELDQFQASLTTADEVAVEATGNTLLHRVQARHRFHTQRISPPSPLRIPKTASLMKDRRPRA